MDGTVNLSVLWPLWVAINVAFQAVLGVVFLYIGAAVLTWSGGLNRRRREPRRNARRDGMVADTGNRG